MFYQERTFVDWKMNLSQRERDCNSLKQSRTVLLVLLGKKHSPSKLALHRSQAKRIPCRKVSVIIHRSLLQLFEKHSMLQVSLKFVFHRFARREVTFQRGMVTKRRHCFVLNAVETTDSDVPVFCFRLDHYSCSSFLDFV